MTDINDKIRAVFLASIMVLSMVAMSAAFVGASAAANQDRGGVGFITDGGDGQNVGDGATVFQGEERIGQVEGSGGPFDLAQLERTGGSNEGLPLQNPIPQDQPTGTYAEPGGVSVTVLEPRINTFDINNAPGGENIAGGGTSTDASILQVGADYNFETAEDISITVEDESGIDVTEEVVITDSTKNQKDEAATFGYDVRYNLSVAEMDTETYEITLEGDEDLDFEQAALTDTVTIVSAGDASISFDSDSVVRGSNNNFNINGAAEGEKLNVTIDSSDLRTEDPSASELRNVFRNVGDVTDVAATSNNESARAELQIDDGTAVGSIRTTLLETGSIDVELYQEQNVGFGNNLGPDEGGTPVDDFSFEVTEGSVSLDSPSGEYSAGSEIEVSGTASEGIEEVGLYVRDGGNWQPVAVDGDTDETISVEGDDSFSEEDVNLAGGNATGNDILSFEGSYRLGVVDPTSVEEENDGSITTSEFNSETSDSQSIRVSGSTLEASVTTVEGEVAIEDVDVDASGNAVGEDTVYYAFIGERGNIAFGSISVDDDNTFSEEDINLVGQDITRGAVSAHFIVDGRDNEFGTGLSGDELVDDLRGLDGQGSLSGDQVRDRVTDLTTEAVASDDLMVTENFRLTDGVTSIDSVSPEGADTDVTSVEIGETMIVEGTTNRQPDDNVITVELFNNESTSVELESTDSWESNSWSVAIDTTDLSAGSYTVEADDGDSADRTDVELVETRQQNPANFEITDFSPEEATVEPGDEVEATVTVENTGGAEATQTVTLEANGGVGELGSADVTLGVGESTTETFSFTAPDVEEDTTVTHTFSTDDDSVSGSLTISPQDPAFFEITEFSPESATVSPGDEVEATVTVENTGDVEGTQTVTLSADNGLGELGSQEVTLGSGESASESFSFTVPDVDSTTEVTHTLATDDDEVSGTLTVEVESDDTTDDSTSDDTGSEDTGSEDTGSEDTGGDDGGSSDDGGPGFGIAAALVAIIGAALLAYRRQDN